MNKSLAKIKAQIEKLQKEAQSLQSGVILRLKKEIAQHGLTAEDLFGSSTTPTSEGRKTRSAPAKRRGKSTTAKYADGQGNTWGGVGKRPQWIHAALESGRSLEEFLVGPAPKQASSGARAAKAGAHESGNERAGSEKPVRRTRKAAVKPVAKRASAKQAKPARVPASKKAAPVKAKRAPRKNARKSAASSSPAQGESGETSA